jgi:hypothetical protein
MDHPSETGLEPLLDHRFPPNRKTAGLTCIPSAVGYGLASLKRRPEESPGIDSPLNGDSPLS